MDECIVPRRKVQEFSMAMEEKLRANDYKGGWHDIPPHFALAMLCDEVAELVGSVHVEDKQSTSMVVAANRLRCAASALRTFGPYAKVTAGPGSLGEAADVGNLAMIVADVLGALKES